MDMTTSEFEQIYKTNYNKLFKVAYRLTGTVFDTEDVLQEAYLSAYKSFENFGERSSVGTWLHRITVNCALAYMKKRTSFPVADMAKNEGLSEASFFENLKSCETVEDEVLYNDMRENCLQMFIECLPKKQRIVFVLKVLMGFSAADVGQILDMSESNVKIHVYRGRTAIKKHMDGKCGLIDDKNPCRCKLWVNYAVENRREDRIYCLGAAQRPFDDLKAQVERELDFLGKIAILYDNAPASPQPDDAVGRMKKIIRNGNLKILG